MIHGLITDGSRKGGEWFLHIGAHRMFERQGVVRLQGEIHEPGISRTCRAGEAAFDGKGQRSLSMAAEPAFLQELKALEEHLRTQLNGFHNSEAQIEARCLLRDRWFENRKSTGTERFRGFWGKLALPGMHPAIFGADPSGKLVFRRGPWEDWPRDLPQQDHYDPAVPLILSPYCGTLFHEAVGHALEAEYLASSPLHGYMGRSVATTALSIEDRPDLEGFAGSMQWDDTGQPVSSTTLIHRGILVGDLDHGRGVLRRESYQQLPLIRATNFLVGPSSANGGDETDWLTSLDRCYYVTWIQSGNWNPGSHHIKALTGPIYYLERGQPRAFLPWIRLRFTMLGLLQSIVAVGPAPIMDPVVHWCVKRHQAVPMSMGSPSILLEGAQS